MKSRSCGDFQRLGVQGCGEAAGRQVEQDALQCLARADPVVGPVRAGGQQRDHARRTRQLALTGRRQSPAVTASEVAAREVRLNALRPGGIGGRRNAITPLAARRRRPARLLMCPGAVSPKREVSRFDDRAESLPLSLVAQDSQRRVLLRCLVRGGPRERRLATARRRSPRDGSCAGGSRRKARVRSRLAAPCRSR